MLILAIDTSTRMGSAAILRDSDVLAAVSGSEITPYSTRLFRYISLLREITNLRMDQFDLYAVAAGPGSFTGLRVGLTAVKAWAEVHGKPIAAVSGLEAIAAESLVPETPVAPNGHFIAPFLDARRGQIYGAIYRRIAGDSMSLKLASDESILSVDEFLQLLNGKAPEAIQLVSPTPEALPPVRIKESLPGAHIVQVSAALAPAIGRLGFDQAKRGDLVDALNLDANYVRRSDAQGAWTDA